MRKPEPHATHYTDVDGGDWIPWPTDRYAPIVRSDLPENPPHGSCRGRLWTHYKLKFWSLRFSDGAEWDCVNGWRPRRR